MKSAMVERRVVLARFRPHGSIVGSIIVVGVAGVGGAGSHDGCYRPH